MIGALRGRLVDLSAASEVQATCLVDVGGVGYEVTLSSRDAARLPGLGAEVHLSIYTHVREGAITLYGFLTPAERRGFELLIAAHGVGPALALAVLSVHTPGSLAKAVATADLEALCLVPGVGRKTAQRLLVELAQRLDVLTPLPAGAPTAPSGARAEVAEALGALGYAPEEVRVALDGVADPEDGEVAAMLRAALARLAPSR